MIILFKMIGSEFSVQGLPAFGGAVGDQGSNVITYVRKKDSESSAISSNFLLIIALLEDMHERG